MRYLLLPFLAWTAAGMLKFFIHFLRFGRGAWARIGYGGFPSTHTTVLSSAVFLLGFERGFFTPAFSFALAVLLLFVIDAHGLRRAVGVQASELNRLRPSARLRERMGHTWPEIGGGLALGAALGYFVSRLGG